MTIYPGSVTGEVTVDGTTVRYLDSVKDHAGQQPFVLVHGTGGSAEHSFWALFPMLASRHRVIAMDLVDQEPGVEELSLDWLVRQVAAVIGAVAPAGAIVLGHSLGAVVAATLAAEQRELVSSLILVAGWAATDGQQSLRNTVWHQLYESNHPALHGFQTLTAHSAGYLNALNDVETDELLAGAAAAPDRSRAMVLNRTIDIRELLPSITAPTLVVGCSEDWMVPVHHSHLLFGGIANANLAVVTAGHAVLVERPAEVFRLAHDFVVSAERYVPGIILSPTHA